jgi:hypothetical protein
MSDRAASPLLGDESRILPYGIEKRDAEVRGELHDVHFTPRLFSYLVSDSSLTPIFFDLDS